jgi:hypothetical protein
MPVRVFDKNNWSNMGVSYVQDRDLDTVQQKIFSDSCMNFAFPEFFSKSYDQKNNNYSNLVLTSSIKFEESFSLINPAQKGNGFVTYISNGIDAIKESSQRYWSINPTVSSNYLEITTNNFFGAKNPNYYFEIDFLPNNLCRISHEYYNKRYYLNLNFLNNNVYLLSSTSDIFNSNSLYQQLYNIFLQKK